MKKYHVHDLLIVFVYEEFDTVWVFDEKATYV